MQAVFLDEQRHEKTCFFHMRKQSQRSAACRQRLCFRYMDSTIPSSSLILNFKLLAICCGFAARFVSGLVRNPKDRLSCDEAQIASETVVERWSLLRSCLEGWTSLALSLPLSG